MERMSIETQEELDALRRVGRVVAETIAEARRRACPGMTTAELDGIGEEVFARHGARSAPRESYDFPGCLCLSVNDEAVHGIPGERVLRAGDLVKVDVTAELDGYVADACESIPVGARRPRDGAALLGRRRCAAPRHVGRHRRHAAARRRRRGRAGRRGARLLGPARPAGPRRRTRDPRASGGAELGRPVGERSPDRRARDDDRADHRRGRPLRWSRIRSTAGRSGRATARAPPMRSTRS